MNAADLIGFIVNGDYYCPACTPTNDKGTPIFGDSETDSFNHCDTCGELIPEGLTGDGCVSVVAALRAFLVTRAGNPEVLRQWAEAIRAYSLDPEENEAASLAREALDADNLTHARDNVLRGCMPGR